MMNKIKLFVFMTKLGGGGAERVMLNLINHLPSDIYEKSLIIVDKKKSNYLGFLKSDIRVIDLNKRRLKKSFFSLRKVLKDEKPEIVITTLFQNNFMVALVKLSLFLTQKKIKLVTRETSFRNQTYGNNFRKIIDYFLIKLTYQLLSDAIIIMSDEARNSFLEKYKIPSNKVRVIYNPIDIEYIRKSQELRPAVNKTKKIITSVGRLAPEKNHSMLVHAIKPLTKLHDIELWIIGSGPQRSNLEKLIIDLELSTIVKLMGHVDNPFEKLNQSTIFVLSSNQEGLPNALLEAMAMGLPVISTECQSGPSEILKSNEYGLLVPVNNVKAMTEAIQTFLEDETAASHYANQSSKRILDFSIRNIIPQYETIFKTILSKSKH